MEGKEDITQQRKANMAKSFKIAAWGAAFCVVASVLDIIMAVKENDSLATPGTLLLILGFIVWGAGMIGAGTNLCNMGHQETGVRTAGGALIFAAIINIIVMVGVKQDVLMEGTMGYVWCGLLILGPGIFYLSLKQEKEKEDKFFDTAAMGMGMVVIVTIVLFAALKIAIHAAGGGGVSIHNVGGYLIEERSSMSALGLWILKHYKIILIVGSSLSTIGYLMGFGSMCTYSDFIKDLKEEKAKKEAQELINEVVADYKDRKAAENKENKETNDKQE